MFNVNINDALKLLLITPISWEIDVYQNTATKEWVESYTEWYEHDALTEEQMKNTMELLEKWKKQVKKHAWVNVMRTKRTSGKPLVGFKIDMIASDLNPIANQLVSEFMSVSSLGDITLREILLGSAFRQLK